MGIDRRSFLIDDRRVQFLLSAQQIEQLLGIAGLIRNGDVSEDCLMLALMRFAAQGFDSTAARLDRRLRTLRGPAP